MLRAGVNGVEPPVLGNAMLISGIHDRIRAHSWSYNMANTCIKSQGKIYTNRSTRAAPWMDTRMKLNGESEGGGSSIDEGNVSVSSPTYSNIMSKPSGRLFGAHEEARKLIFQKTGKTTTQIAIDCFKMGQRFEKMSWRAKMDIAVKRSLNCIENHRS